MEASELKPCPWCGNRNQGLFSLEKEPGTRRSHVVCVNCEAAGPLVPGYDWNIRADLSTLTPALLERVRAWPNTETESVGEALEIANSLLRDILEAHDG